MTVSFFSDMTLCLSSLWISLSRISYVCHIIFWRRRVWSKSASLSKLCWMRLRPARHSSHESHKHEQVSLARAHTHTHTNTTRRSLRNSLDRVHLFLLEQVILSLQLYAHVFLTFFTLLCSTVIWSLLPRP